MEKDYYRLEYNENQGFFHLEDYKSKKYEENKNGWMTICAKLSDEQYNEFVDIMFEKYPAIN